MFQGYVSVLCQMHAQHRTRRTNTGTGPERSKSEPFLECEHQAEIIGNIIILEGKSVHLTFSTAGAFALHHEPIPRAS